MGSAKVGTLTIDLKANSAQFYQEMRGAANRFNSTLNQMRDHAAAFSRNMKMVLAGFVGVNLLGDLRRAVSSTTQIITDFEKSTSETKAIIGASADEMARMSSVARDLGASTIYSASEVMDSMKLLGQAGFTTEQIIQSVGGTLDLAGAGMLDMATAADITTSILNTFQMSANEATRVADLLAQSANASNIDVSGMGEAMKFAGPAAKSLQMSIEETAAAIMALSNAGFKGEMAGTGLRQVLLGTATPTKELQNVLGGLTVETGGLIPILERLQKANLTTGDTFTMFGDRGGGAALILASMSGKVKEFEEALKKSGGASKRMMETMWENVSGAKKEMESALEELMLQIGDGGLTGALKNAYDQMARLFLDMVESGRAAQFGEILAGSFNRATEAIITTTTFLSEFSIGLNEFFGNAFNYLMAEMNGGSAKDVQDFYKKLEDMRRSENSDLYDENRKYNGPQSISIPAITPMPTVAAPRNELSALTRKYTEAYPDAWQTFLQTRMEIDDLTKSFDENGYAMMDARTAILAIDDAERKLMDSLRESRLASDDWKDGLKQSLLDIERSSREVAKNFYGAFNEVFSQLTDSLSEFFTTGKLGLKELEQGILSTFNRLMVQQLIIGPMAGMFNNLFGTNLLNGFNARAVGGLATAGGAYLVGEHGPELFTPSVSGLIANATDTQRAMQSGAPVVNQTVNIQAQDAGGFNRSLDQILTRMNAAQRRVFRRYGGV